MSDEAWREYRRDLPATMSNAARTRLLHEYVPLTKERLDLGSHAGVVPRAEEPVYRWARYKEAYSPCLVRELLHELLPKQLGWPAGEAPVVYDPMVGSGTTLLVAAERGLPALGADLMPYAAFLSATLARWTQADPNVVRQIANDALARYSSFAGRDRLDVPAAEWAFSFSTLRTLTKLIRAVDDGPGGVERDLVRLGVLSAVEQVSYAVKDGTSLRRRLPGGPARPGRPGQQRRVMGDADVVAVVRQRIDSIVADLEYGSSLFPSGYVDGVTHVDEGERAGAASLQEPGSSVSRLMVVRADARKWRPARESCSVVMFSPPYPNRYDYSAVYQLELALGEFVSDAAGLRRLRKQLLRSHLEAPSRDAYRVELPALHEFLAAVNGSRSAGDQSGRILRMVAGFFEDMVDVLDQLREALRPGGSVGLVVGTQTYLGQHLPTDLLLAELAHGSGLEVRELWVVRAKGVASQQRGRSALPSRESVLVLRKPADRRSRSGRPGVTT